MSCRMASRTLGTGLALRTVGGTLSGTVGGTVGGTVSGAVLLGCCAARGVLTGFSFKGVQRGPSLTLLAAGGAARELGPIWGANWECRDAAVLFGGGCAPGGGVLALSCCLGTVGGAVMEAETSARSCFEGARYPALGAARWGGVSMAAAPARSRFDGAEVPALGTARDCAGLCGTARWGAAVADRTAEAVGSC